jgi:hypothetical protein
MKRPEIKELYEIALTAFRGEWDYENGLYGAIQAMAENDGIDDDAEFIALFAIGYASGYEAALKTGEEDKK